MTMFRVLSEEEAAKAIKWKAPDFGTTASHIVQARDVVSPVTLNSIEPGANAPSLPVTPAVASAPTSAPALQAAQSQENVPSSVSEALSSPSVDMLQSSYDDGFAQGYADGSKALRDTKIVELNNLISSITQSTPPSQEDSLESEIYGLSVDIARILLQREIRTEPDAMARLVKAGLDQLPSNTSGPKQIHLHPLDAQLVKQELNDIPESAFIVDETLTRGQCRIQSESSTVHAGLENWLSSMAVELGVLPENANALDVSTTHAVPE